MRNDIPEALKRYGFQIDVRDPYSFHLGCVQLVMRERDELIGVADPRRDGAAGGPAPRSATKVSPAASKAARKAKDPTARVGGEP
jgi:hypothetical protein